MKDKVSYWSLRRRAHLTVQSWSNDIRLQEDVRDEDIYEPLIGTDMPPVFSITCTVDTNERADAAETSCLYRPVRRHKKRERASNEDNLLYDYDDEEGRNIHEYSDSDGTVEDCEDDDSLTDQLSAWAVSEKVTDTAVNKLLKILKPHHPDLPLTSRTLMNNGHPPADIVKIAGGEYVHFGILNGMKRFEIAIVALGINVIEYHINIDGLPLFRSSGTQLWPILGRIVGVSSPFMIGAFCGSSKPPDVSQFLSCFIEEAKALKSSGFTLKGISFTAQPACFICDAPARALIKQTKSHTGYYACDRCVEKGEYIQGRVTFPQLTADRRTDELFANVAYDDHQSSRSPLIDLECQLVSTCVLDYMHLVCLGIVRRLLHFWLRGALGVRLSARHVSLISQMRVSMRGNIPSEFARKPRALTELEYWKASELRQFLLYTGMVVLKEVKMAKKLYEHFVCLSVIMHILLSSSLCRHYSEYVEELAVAWVRMSSELYGKHFVVYNVHCLIHLVDDCRNFGSLNHVSAFPFENFMRVLKAAVRKPQHILQQLSNRMAEGFFDTACSADLKQHNVKREHSGGPLVVGVLHCKQYRQLQLRDFVVKVSSPDNCIMYRTKIGLVVNIVSDGNTVSMLVQKFGRMKSFFRKPLNSSDIGIYKVDRLSKHMEVCSVSDIQRKYVLLPYRDGRKWIAIPLNHTV